MGKEIDGFILFLKNWWEPENNIKILVIWEHAELQVFGLQVKGPVRKCQSLSVSQFTNRNQLLAD